MLLDTPVCDFGWNAPNFTLNTPDGAAHQLSDYLAKGPVLVMFICNHCPYVQRIADELAATCKALSAQGISTLAVMSNDYRDYPSDAPDQMAAFGATHGFEFPYLVDEDQAVGKAYGAICTPDFFGLNDQGELQYRGRFVSPEGAPELFDAMVQIAKTGHGPQDQTASMGCSIKWTR